jgi:hypothetical protein
MFILICPGVISQTPTGDQSSEDAITSNTSSTRADFTHTVFAEDITAEWCVYCPSASETLKSIYESGDLDFYFVCMITQNKTRATINEDAQQRANDYNVAGYPTVEFDGGYEEVIGGQSDETNYRAAIESCGARDVPPLEIELTSNYNGPEDIQIDAKVSNLGADTYTGNLRVYIVEIVSRYDDYDGNKYPYGFLDYAINTDISIDPSDAYSDSVTWNSVTEKDGLGDPYNIKDPDNILLIATVFNSDSNIKIRPPPNSGYYVAYYADQTTAAKLGDSPPPTQDITPPDVEIIQPQDDNTVKGTIEVQAKATDNTGIDEVMFRAGSQSWVKMSPSPSNSGIYVAQWDTTSVPDGRITLSVEAKDLAKNSDQDSVTVTVSNQGGSDNIPPTIDIQNPRDQETISGTVLIRAKVTDNWGVERVDYQLDNSNSVPMYPSSTKDIYEQSWDTTKVSDGFHTIVVNAEDSSGNSNSQSVLIQVDNSGGTQPPVDTEPPDLHILEPKKGETLEGTIDIRAWAYDKSDVIKVECSIVSGASEWLALRNLGSNEWKLSSFDTTVYPDGDYELILRAVDGAGNEASSSVSVEIKNDYFDELKPTLKIVVPENGDTVRKSVQITVEAVDDSASGIRYVEYRVDSGDWLQMVNVRNNVYGATWDTTRYSDGSHLLTIRAFDFSDNLQEITLDLQISNKKEESPSSDMGLPGFEGVFVAMSILVVVFLIRNRSNRR